MSPPENSPQGCEGISDGVAGARARRNVDVVVIVEPAAARWGAFRSVLEEHKLRMIPRKLYKIGEIMRYTGLSRQTIHNYTTLGLLTEEERTESGHRLYSEDVFARIERIKELRRKCTLREIIRILKQESQETSGKPSSSA